MITSTSLKHPVMQERILNALIEAQADLKADGGHGQAYIQNSGGKDIMRVDIFKPGVLHNLPAGGVVVYGRKSVDITGMVETALGQKFCELI
ncbi:hypothetical protein D3C76_165420 [compost metagenome]